MRSIYLLLIAITLSIPTTAQPSERPPVDSVKLRLTQLEKVYQRRTDSLQRELLYYKAKEDHFANAVSDQANFFLAVFGGTLTLLGILAVFINLGYFRSQFDAIRADYTKRVSDNIKQLEDLNAQNLERLEQVQEQAAEIEELARYHSSNIQGHLTLFLEILSGEARAEDKLYSSISSGILSLMSIIATHGISPNRTTLVETKKRAILSLKNLIKAIDLVQRINANPENSNQEWSFAHFFTLVNDESVKASVKSLSDPEIDDLLYEFLIKAKAHIAQYKTLTDFLTGD
ncbi:hypothetical protein [Fibrivirga algicola]|uniref:Uncharacterized protein n=1 Tax=Fibrivirga algicola TaxID=2950420 RepID=A0ABX0QS05_9BACT|nr:hypothetical protein [Fibrivirga algicola]NID13777.1 hypothetical protein [Fibrivirga algicola]